MKKYLTPILAVIAVVAIVFCFVINGQKGDLQKKLDEATGASSAVEAAKTEAEGKLAEAETKVNDLQKQIDDAAKAAAETATAAVEEVKDAAAKTAEAATETAAAAAEEVKDAAAETAEAAAETVAAAVEEVKDAAAETAEAAAETVAAAVEEVKEAVTEEAKVLTHAEFVAAENDTEVVIESYVQAHQNWWDNKVTVYLQSEDGAYFAYEMKCTEEEAAKLVPGQKIRVKGYKAEWSGEVEITDGTFELLEADPWIAEAEDITAVLGTDDLINHMNEFVAVKGATIVDYDGNGAAFAYKNAEEKTDDLYFKVDVNGQTYDFCVEFYLCGKDSDVYKAVEGLKVGDTVDLEGFLYWYNGANLQATSLTVK